MKRIIPFLAFIFITFVASAQVIEINPNPKEMFYEGQDLSDNYLDNVGKYDVTNMTSEQVSLRWRRLETPNCPMDWEYLVCDNNNCYSSSVVTNIDNGLDAAVLEANEVVTDLFSLHVKPKGSPGCCTVQIEYYLDADPATVIETAIFEVKINDPTCDAVSTSEEVISALRVFPNPMTDYFQLEGNDANDIKELAVYNLIGRQVRSFDATNATSFDMGGLPGGIYLIGMIGEDGDIVKTVRISRQIVRP
jgi:hypothetical protein